jgi:hypothetical protein
VPVTPAYAVQNKHARMDEPSDTTVALLTDDLILYILCKLDVKAILCCATACKQWQSLCDSDKLWERLYEVRFHTACSVIYAHVSIPLCIDDAHPTVDHWSRCFSVAGAPHCIVHAVLSFGVSGMTRVHGSK